jgi:hypothetical protein
MRRSLLSLIVLLMMAVPGCDVAGPPPTATRTPRPTITPTRTVAPVTAGAETATAPAVFTETATSMAPVTGSPAPTDTAIPSPTPTLKPGVARPTPQSLTVTNVLILGVERDPLRDQGAIVSIQVVYSGGRAPYTVYHDDTEQQNNPFKVLSVCNGTIVHTIRIVSGDKQSVTKKYYFSPIVCPP